MAFTGLFCKGILGLYLRPESVTSSVDAGCMSYGVTDSGLFFKANNG
ncbi:MAG: hypothetical protein P8X74_15645 [Reinekea sp.]